MKYVISIDWFQYFCKRTSGNVPSVGTYLRGAKPSATGKYYQYKIVNAKEFHSIYRLSFTVQLQGYDVCHVHMLPKSSALDAAGCAIKVANRILYSSMWSFHLHNIVDALGLEIHSITRFDLCCDFVEFANGMLPSDFIHHYVRDTASADTETYVRCGSNKYEVIGVKRMLDEEGQSATLTKQSLVSSIVSSFEYIRFGSRASGVSTYLYNKSEELRSKHSKPWIRQSWIDAGLIEKEYKNPKDEPQVYRLEMSVQAKAMNLAPKNQDGTINVRAMRRLCIDDLNTQRVLEETFWLYRHKYFRFKVCTGQKYVKDMKDLNLFDVELEPFLKPVYISSAVSAGRAEKNAAVALNRLKFNAPILSTNERNILWQAADILQNLGVQLSSRALKHFQLTEDVKENDLMPESQYAYVLRQASRNEVIDYMLRPLRDPRICALFEEYEADEQRLTDKAFLADYDYSQLFEP